MKIHDCIQGSPEWHLLRLGMVTGSRFKDAQAQNRQKTGPGETSIKYMAELIAERIKLEPAESYTSEAMQWGTATESEARMHYQEATDNIVTQVGFVQRDEYVGCSPDGLVGSDGMVEIKCPNSATHLKYVMIGGLPRDYEVQVQGNLWVCERQWCDFVSYDPRLEHSFYYKFRVERDDEYIAKLESKIDMFVTEMQKELEKLTFSPF